MMGKHWYVSLSVSSSQRATPQMMQNVIEEHPADYAFRLNEKYRKSGETYILVFAIEISEEQFAQMKGMM
jgi:hypothetical protein